MSAPVVEAYLSYYDYLNGQQPIKYIFDSIGQYHMMRQEYILFTRLYVVSRGEVTRIDYIADTTDIDDYDINDNEDY